MSKKDKKILITISFVILLIIVSFFIGLHITKTNLTNAAINYLCEKYNATENDFELIDYERSKCFLNDDAIPQFEKGYYKWEFKYNDRNFFVNLIDGKYYDDYQLEDVEKWCVEWLRTNVNHDIELITLSSIQLFAYQMYCDDNHYNFTSNNIDSFLSSNEAFYWKGEKVPVGLYYYNQNGSEYDFKLNYESKLNPENFYFSKANKIDIKKKNYKSGKYWTMYFENISKG